MGAANIALKKVIPGMQRGDLCEVSALASRDLAKAQRAAAELGIPKSYGSYEELLQQEELLEESSGGRQTRFDNSVSALIYFRERTHKSYAGQKEVDRKTQAPSHFEVAAPCYEEEACRASRAK